MPRKLLNYHPSSRQVCLLSRFFFLKAKHVLYKCIPHTTLFLKRDRAHGHEYRLTNIRSQESDAGSGLNIAGHTLLRPGGVRQQEYRLKPRDPATKQTVP